MSGVSGAGAPRHERVRAALDHPDVRAALQDAAVPLPDDALEWLAQICLLEGLPFDAIVPAAAMLEPESIRFFHVDQNWIDALVDGALSIVNLSPDHDSVLELTRQGARDGAHAATPARRAVKLAAAAAPAPGPPAEPEAAAEPAPPPAGHWSGFLLRSCVVTDVPGLVVKAFPDAAGAQPALRPLRLEHISPTILMAIFDGVLQRVEISKPAQVLHFGVEPVHDFGPPFQVQLRGIEDGDKYGLGVEIPDQHAPLKARTETGGPEVVDVLATVAGLGTALATQLGKPSVTLTPATLGVQMVQGTERAVFTNG